MSESNELRMLSEQQLRDCVFASDPIDDQLSIYFNSLQLPPSIEAYKKELIEFINGEIQRGGELNFMLGKKTAFYEVKNWLEKEG